MELFCAWMSQKILWRGIESVGAEAWRSVQERSPEDRSRAEREGDIEDDWPRPHRKGTIHRRVWQSKGFLGALPEPTEGLGPYRLAGLVRHREHRPSPTQATLFFSEEPGQALAAKNTAESKPSRPESHDELGAESPQASPRLSPRNIRKPRRGRGHTG